MAAAEVTVVPVGLTNFLLIATCLLGLFFGVAYTIKKKWWRYQMGWNLFVLRFALGVILLPFTLHTLVGISVTTPFYQWFSTVVFIVVPMALLHITWLLFFEPKTGQSKPALPDLALKQQLEPEPMEPTE